MLGRSDTGEPLEEVREVTARLDAVRLRGFDQAIEVRAGPSARHGVREEPILATYNEGTDRVLHEVGVERQATVVQHSPVKL